MLKANLRSLVRLVVSTVANALLLCAILVVITVLVLMKAIGIDLHYTVRESGAALTEQLKGA